MMRFARPCLQCNKLHKDKGDYCLACRQEKERLREANPERIARKRLLYGGSYPAKRKQMIEEVLYRGLPCHICKQSFTGVGDITADHLDAGNPSSPLAPAHRSCNSSRGNTPL
jgi:hypothetical protein